MRGSGRGAAAVTIALTVVSEVLSRPAGVIHQVTGLICLATLSV